MNGNQEEQMAAHEDQQNEPRPRPLTTADIRLAIAMTRASQEQVEQVIGGALFDFAAWLTTLPEAVTLGAEHEAPPAVELLTRWAAERGLSLDHPDVGGWQRRAWSPRVALAVGQDMLNEVGRGGGGWVPATTVRGWAERLLCQTTG